MALLLTTVLYLVFLVVLKDVVSLTLGECVSTHMEPPDVVLTIMTSFQIVLCALCVFASVASPSAHCQAPDALPWTCASSCAPAARASSPLAEPHPRPPCNCRQPPRCNRRTGSAAVPCTIRLAPPRFACCYSQWCLCWPAPLTQCSTQCSTACQSPSRTP